MRITALTILALVASPAIAGPSACPYKTASMYEHLLTPDQRKAAFDGQQNGDPVVDELAPRIKSMMHPSATPIGEKSITWEQSRALILLGLIRSTFEFGDGSVVLVALSGSSYRTKPPSTRALWAVLDSVDPCLLFISRAVVAVASNRSSGRER